MKKYFLRVQNTLFLRNLKKVNFDEKEIILFFVFALFVKYRFKRGGRTPGVS